MEVMLMWLYQGASEIVLGLCTTRLHADGSVATMSPSDRKQMEDIIQQMATNALRTICFAFADVDPSGIYGAGRKRKKGH